MAKDRPSMDRSRSPSTFALIFTSVLVICGISWLVFVGAHDKDGAVGSTLAYWVQGVGTIIAVFIAATVAIWQTDEARAREARRERRFNEVVVGMCHLATDNLVALGDGMREPSNLALPVKNGGPWPTFRPVGGMLRSVDIGKVPDALAALGVSDLILLCARGDELVDRLRALTPQERLSEDLREQLQRLALEARDAFSRVQGPLIPKGETIEPPGLEGDLENKYRVSIAKLTREICLATLRDISRSALLFSTEERVAAMHQGNVPWPDLEPSRFVLAKIDIAQLPSEIARNRIQDATLMFHRYPDAIGEVQAWLGDGGDWEFARNKFEGWADTVTRYLREASRKLAEFDDGKIAPEEDDGDC